ncbi:hypothetical protein Tco_0335223 [Tanacetum coccineum]
MLLNGAELLDPLLNTSATTRDTRPPNVTTPQPLPPPPPSSSFRHHHHQTTTIIITATTDYHQGCVGFNNSTEEGAVWLGTAREGVELGSQPQESRVVVGLGYNKRSRVAGLAVGTAGDSRGVGLSGLVCNKSMLRLVDVEEYRAFGIGCILQKRLWFETRKCTIRVRLVG